MENESNQTVRQQIVALLEESECSVRDISKAISVREKEIFGHLEHIHLSMKSRKEKLHVSPYHCQLCGFVFENRKKFTRPGRCPKCKKGRIEAATYHIS
ncbi:MAG: transcriptional regulator [Proteobacteria bacterium]|nr:transcriptional regulator [Pseudomonadota bacterium]